MRDVDSTNITLEYLLLKATTKELGKEKALFNCFDGFLIRDFGNT